jgi:hypothetical protein
MSDATRPAIWLAAGVRTPFLKVDQAFGGLDAVALSVRWSSTWSACWAAPSRTSRSGAR